MKTFLIQNGDLVLGPGGFTTVTGAAKVKQDLAVAVKEPLGTDRFHPRWGSLLGNFVGTVGDPFTRQQVVSEITRIIRNYVAVHGDQLRADITGGRRSRYSTHELVADIDGVDVRQEFDRLYVRVNIRTVGGDQVVLTSATGV
jgi:hypothetical protein